MYSPEYGRIQCGVLNCTHQATPIVHKGRDRLKAKQIARFWDRLCQLQDLSTSTLCLLQDLVASTTVTVARSFHRLIVCASQANMPVVPVGRYCVASTFIVCQSQDLFTRQGPLCWLADVGVVCTKLDDDVCRVHKPAFFHLQFVGTLPEKNW